MSDKRNEDLKQFIIPENFMGESRLFQGQLKTRNVVEGGLISGVLAIFFWNVISVPITTKISLVIFFSAPLGLLGLFGVNGDPLSTFIKIFFSWRRKRGLMLFNNEARALKEAPITQLLAALEAGEPVPQGKDYQHGPQYGYDTLREAVFERDHYTCVYCKRGLKDGAILHVHHAYYWKGLHGNSMRELATCCEKCNTPANHKEGGKLWGFDKPLRKYTGEAFMNSVRWILYQRAMARFQGAAEVHMTYGVISKRVRTNLGLPYSCATDAYCMGELRPEARCETEVFQKYRRNNRVLSKFYDAKYYDTREKGVIRSGNELSSGRTNRNHNLDGENLRRFRGCKKSKGRTSTRKQRYAMQPGDIVVYGNRKYVSKGCSSYGKALSLLTDGKPLMVSMKKIQLVRHKGGWVRLPHAAAEAKK